MGFEGAEIEKNVVREGFGHFFSNQELILVEISLQVEVKKDEVGAKFTTRYV